MRPRFLDPTTTIDRNQTLAGVPILQIRAFLHRVRDTNWFADVVEKAFPGSGRDVLQELIEQGYVHPLSQAGIFKVTMKGEALVRLSALRPVVRTRA